MTEKQTLDAAMKRILTVSKAELNRRMEAEKQAKSFSASRVPVVTAVGTFGGKSCTAMLSSTFAGSYDYRLVTLSILIAILSAYAALDLAGRVCTTPRIARAFWLTGGSLAMGGGIWAMHYIGMAAYQLPVDVLYDWPTTVLSLFAAIAASAVALVVVSRAVMRRSVYILGGTVMGCGIAAMHYIGMAAMRLPAMCTYSPFVVAFSIALAIALSILAQPLVFALRDSQLSWQGRKLGGAVLLGLAIAAMHYVGMAAVTFHAASSYSGSLANAVRVSSLGLTGIALVTTALLTVAVVAAVTHRIFSTQANQILETRIQAQTIFDNLKEAIVVLDRQQSIVTLNHAARQMLGLSESTHYKGQLLATFEAFLPNGQQLPPEDWPSARALRGEFLQSTEIEIRKKNHQKSIIVEVSTAPIKDHFGNLVQVIVCYRDVTQPKEIGTEHSRLAAIVESSEDAIIGKDLQGTVTSWNAGAEKIFGYTSEEMVGHSIKILLPEDRLHEEDEILARIRKGEIVDHIETIRKRKNGQFIHVSLTISPIRDASGVIVGASKIARDITDRKQMETRLYEGQKMEAIGQLTGGIAHDFNNLLGVIVGNLDLLERAVPGNEPALKRIATAQKAATRGADLTRRLLAFASNEQLSPAAVRIEVPIQTTIELASRVLGAEIQIITHFDNSIPPVLVDSSGLENAILNIFVNARDAMPKGGIITVSTTLEVVVRGEARATNLKSGRYACVSISDTGIGMSRQDLERAFEPFFSTKERGKGTGLGLAMVYGFFKQSGGAAHIYSEPGYGTTLSFYLPLAKTEVLPPGKAPSHTDDSSLPDRTILIVDDEPDLVEVAYAYLTDAGYSALHAHDAAHALEILHLHPEIDLLFTDIVMPGGMDGVDLARKALELRTHLRVIYCSGFPASALADRNVELIAGPLLRKPYQRSELLTLIRRTLRQDSHTKLPAENNSTETP